MAAQSRVAPSSRTSERALSIAKPARALPSDRRERLPFMTIHASSFADFGSPPAKRRKLDIVRHRQTTLDAFAIPRPQLPTRPSRVDVTSPNGVQLLPATPNSMPPKATISEDAAGNHREGSISIAKPSCNTITDTQPTESEKKKEERRTLRSQDDGPRLKSELATYFPDYEAIMLDAPREPEFVTLNSALYITDTPMRTTNDPTSPVQPPKLTKGSSDPNSARPTSPSSPTQTNISIAQHLDMVTSTLPEVLDDPLGDEHFFKAHRRAERKEKQLRNIERERAMHEKVQLERLLDGLLGHDWLKVLGITGITDGESKKYEPKRNHFIREVKTLVNKFRQWKEQEKKQRLEREEAAAQIATQEAGSEDDVTEDDDDDDDDVSASLPSSDLNASATRQLQQEAARAARPSPKLKLLPAKSKNTTTGGRVDLSAWYVLPPPETPIVSFYEKRHLRDAALGKARHGRNVTAFGHPIPEMEEQIFCLPSEYVTEDALRSNARQRRRRKRESMATT